MAGRIQHCMGSFVDSEVTDEWGLGALAKAAEGAHDQFMEDAELESRWYAESQVKAEVESEYASEDAAFEQGDAADAEPVKSEDDQTVASEQVKAEVESEYASEDAASEQGDAADADAPYAADDNAPRSPAYNPFCPPADDNAPQSPAQNVGHGRFASAPWNARAASRSPRRSPDHHLPIGARVVVHDHLPPPPPPPASREPTAAASADASRGPEHASRGKDEHGKRRPRARGGKMKAWHTGFKRAQKFSSWAQYAFVHQYPDKSAFSEDDLRALEVYSLHLQAGGRAC